MLRQDVHEGECDVDSVSTFKLKGKMTRIMNHLTALFAGKCSDKRNEGQ